MTDPTVSDDERARAAAMLHDEEGDLYRAIGYFIYWFSQLEFTMKATAAARLHLGGDKFSIVVGPYDFVSLCNVTEKLLLLEAPAEETARMKDFFSRCKALNDKARVVVAHGTWTMGGAAHISRSSLTTKMHFEDSEELNDQGDVAKALMAMLVELRLKARGK